MERAMGIEPMSEGWEATKPDSPLLVGSLIVHAAKVSAREYRKGRVKMAASVHCSPPQPIEDSWAGLRRPAFLFFLNRKSRNALWCDRRKSQKPAPL
jgi:hypothetical protein